VLHIYIIHDAEEGRKLGLKAGTEMQTLLKKIYICMEMVLEN
jgi:hypothetical protein